MSKVRGRVPAAHCPRETRAMLLLQGSADRQAKYCFAFAKPNREVRRALVKIMRGEL